MPHCASNWWRKRTSRNKKHNWHDWQIPKTQRRHWLEHTGTTKKIKKFCRFVFVLNLGPRFASCEMQLCICCFTLKFSKNLPCSTVFLQRSGCWRPPWGRDTCMGRCRGECKCSEGYWLFVTSCSSEVPSDAFLAGLLDESLLFHRSFRSFRYSPWNPLFNSRAGFIESAPCYKMLFASRRWRQAVQMQGNATPKISRLSLSLVAKLTFDNCLPSFFWAEKKNRWCRADSNWFKTSD